MSHVAKGANLLTGLESSTGLVVASNVPKAPLDAWIRSGKRGTAFWVHNAGSCVATYRVYKYIKCTSASVVVGYG